MDSLGPPPYEMRLAERPADRAEFEAFVAQLIYRSRPGIGYHFLFGRKRYESERAWEQIVRSLMGRAYELGRRV